MVKQIESKIAFQEALVGAGDKLVVVDFSATWCGPCKMIKPFFHSLSEKYSNVVFLEVDVDDCQDVASECEVKCMPTFQFFKKGQKVGTPDLLPSWPIGKQNKLKACPHFLLLIIFK
ncbi:thioredoxin isoform X1 [Mustela erminea]|uniref:thioredoxin isoform X1 n=1 Tax=Mustela erminea TaxID=36723 RepID=UPI0013872DF2|nr:thioredoxin isoform X1 [Mustela erminea]